MPFIPSPQQHNFLDWAQNGSGSCVLEAVAGAGKTTTVLGAVDRMPGQHAILAYNRKIAEEIGGKLKSAGYDFRKAQAGTVHSFGFSAFRKEFPNVRIEGDKVGKIADELIAPPGLEDAGVGLGEYRSVIVKLVSLAKQRALGVIERFGDDDRWLDIIEHFGLLDECEVELDEDQEHPVAAIIEKAKEIMRTSNRDTATIDFDDMVYLPLLYKVRFWKFDVVMVDEAQDTNPARRALVRALVKKGGRVIAVGDRHQAIYGFTGADSDSLDLIAEDFNCVRMPLTVTYRCPKAVVAFAQQWVSHIEAHESAPEGKVSEIDMQGFLSLADMGAGDAVLCRNTKPLVALAFALIRRRIPCRVEGKDIAARLKSFTKRWKVRSIEDFVGRLDAYFERQMTKLLAAKQEAQLQALEDCVETLKVVAAQCLEEGKTRMSDLLAFLDDLFGDDVTDVLVLSTIHKSKGREWPRVFWLDRAGTCPSRWARQGWQKEQENNLCYVAATRAQSILIDLLAPEPAQAAEPRQQAA
ncbi:MAG: hypothetical protein DI527_00525 [Chelatococcus sp.]|nr:MAG: hypothetical protein DI527_00525 [Chelatococcus sp.]